MGASGQPFAELTTSTVPPDRCYRSGDVHGPVQVATGRLSEFVG